MSTRFKIEKMKEIVENGNEGSSRRNFLKKVGVGVGAISVTGIGGASLLKGNEANAKSGKKVKLLSPDGKLVEADQDDMDTLLTLLGTAGCNFIMGIPGADDIMLNYQSTSFHDALYIRKLLGLKPAPEFEEWLINNGIMNHKNELLPFKSQHKLLALINK